MSRLISKSYRISSKLFFDVFQLEPFTDDAVSALESDFIDFTAHDRLSSLIAVKNGRALIGLIFFPSHLA